MNILDNRSSNQQTLNEEIVNKTNILNFILKKFSKSKKTLLIVYEKMIKKGAF